MQKGYGVQCGSCYGNTSIIMSIAETSFFPHNFASTIIEREIEPVVFNQGPILRKLHFLPNIFET